MEKSRGKAKIAYDQKDGSQGAEWISYDAGRLRELNKGGGGASADNKRKSEGGGSAAGGGSAKKGKLVLPSCPKVIQLPLSHFLCFAKNVSKSLVSQIYISLSTPVPERRRKRSTRAATSPQMSLASICFSVLISSSAQVPKKAGAGGESAKSAESPVPAAASKQAATPSGGGDVEMGGMEEEAGKGESQGTDLQKGCSVRVLYDDEGWFGGTIKA
jgi:hypothetical protein